MGCTYNKPINTNIKIYHHYKLKTLNKNVIPIKFKINLTFNLNLCKKYIFISIMLFEHPPDTFKKNLNKIVDSYYLQLYNSRDIPLFNLCLRLRLYFKIDEYHIIRLQTIAFLIKNTEYLWLFVNEVKDLLRKAKISFVTYEYHQYLLIKDLQNYLKK